MFQYTLILNSHHLQYIIHNITTSATFLQLKSGGTEASTQTHDSSSDTIELKLNQEAEMDSQQNEFSVSEITLRSVDERIKHATDPFVGRVEEQCALLANRSELKSSGNSEATK